MANGFTAAKTALPPEKALQWEFGLKAEALKGVSATLAFFQITKSNVATRDFMSFDPSAVRLAGLQRSRGVELDIIGRLTDRATILANYADVDVRVIADNPMNRLNPFGALDPAIYGAAGGFLGAYLPNVPRHSGKIALTYDLGDDGLGPRLGGSVTARSQA